MRWRTPTYSKLLAFNIIKVVSWRTDSAHAYDILCQQNAQRNWKKKKEKETCLLDIILCSEFQLSIIILIWLLPRFNGGHMYHSIADTTKEPANFLVSCGLRLRSLRRRWQRIIKDILIFDSHRIFLMIQKWQAYLTFGHAAATSMECIWRRDPPVSLSRYASWVYTPSHCI